MSDDTRKRGKPDRIRISTQRHEIAYWTKALGITKARLRDAVEKVGPMTANVKRYLIDKIKKA